MAALQISGIEKTPGVCGGSACIVRTRIPVWLLLEAKNAGATEASLLTSYPALRAEDLTNAWAYYRANKEEVDFIIQENEAGNMTFTKLSKFSKRCSVKAPT